MINLLGLIPAPWRVIALVSLVVAFFGSAYAMGYTKAKKLTTASYEAAKVAELKKYQSEYQKAIDRANVLAQKLASRETEIVYKTREVIKHVPKFTDGKSCLSADAVRLLNHRDSAVPEAPGEPAPESPADAPADNPGATDTEVAYWAADAIERYEIAAARLNALIDYLEKSE